MDALADEIALTQGQTTTHRGTSAGCPLGVQRIDIEREVDGGIIANVSESHLDHTTDTVTIMRKKQQLGNLSYKEKKMAWES